MIPYLFMHTGQQMSDRRFPVDDPWAYSIRVQIFCRNQEEHDYLSALNLIHGRAVEINIWDEWVKTETGYMSMTDEGIRITRSRPKVLPIVYTTFPIDLRGY